MQRIATLFLTWLICSNVHGQFDFGVSEASISMYYNQFALPFTQFTPIHPGVELGVVFLKKDNQSHVQKVSGYVGFFHHKVIANAPYFKVNYDYQYKIKKILGLNAYVGIGYLHAFYPGDGYSFNSSKDAYEQVPVNQAFFLSNLGLGLNYIKPKKKIHPFIKYEIGLAGFNADYLQTNFHVGFSIKL